MPKPQLRTRSRKRETKRLPGTRTTIHYKQKKVGASHCVKCGRLLQSTPKLAPSKMHGLPASQRRLHRMYGSQLCHVCLQEALKQAVRSESVS
jgi:large subunit ribosomal protein L34e